MHLSRIVLNPRSRIAQEAFSDRYAMHRLVWRGYPDHRFEPDGEKQRILFRMEMRAKDELPFILVQSPSEPDWSPLMSEESILAHDMRTFSPAFLQGQRLRFRLRANPTFCQGKDTPAVPATPTTPAQKARFGGRRYAHLTRKAQGDWLARKGKEHGFSLPLLPSGADWLDPFYDEPEKAEKESPFDIRISPIDWQHGNKPGFDNPLKHYGVDFDGTLTVTDPAALAAAVAGGIGPAKGFGFGLLSLARA